MVQESIRTVEKDEAGQEVNGTATTDTVSYLMGATGPVYRKDGAGRLNWYVTDGLGSTVAEVDGQGGVIVARSFDVYGQARAYWMRGQQGRVPPDETSKHKFVGALGHPSEGETGLIYMRARYMDSETGRFVSEDPAAHGANWFVYCNNDPVGRVDRDGKMPVIIGALIVGAVTGLAIYLVYTAIQGGPITVAGALKWAACGAAGSLALVGVGMALIEMGMITLGSALGLGAIGASVSMTSVVVGCILGWNIGLFAGLAAGAICTAIDAMFSHQAAIASAAWIEDA